MIREDSVSLSEYLVGVDIGGTHTDICAAAGPRLVRGKALTTHDDYSVGILQAMEVVAARLGTSQRELLAGATAMVNGTTIVTNVITELRGARVGVLITEGFKDTFRFAGGARMPVYDDQAQVNPPDIAERSAIEEVAERVTSDGAAVVPLDEEGVRQAVRRLRNLDVEAIAVCFLWSFKNDAHELRAREIILSEWPEVFVSLSSEVFPVIREHERFYACLFNCFCQPVVHALFDNLQDRLREHGFKGSLSFFSGAGGAIGSELARKFPILLLQSGPAGGVTGAIHLAKLMGYEDVMVGDMGGTSFDTTLVEHLEPSVVSRVSIRGLNTGVSVLDILSIGAGGGSIAWIDDRGVPQVGPRSAGSVPGPVCYGLGGKEPTVTDAAVVAGLIDPRNYLDGRVELDRDAADRALGEYAGNFGWSAAGAATAILELTVTNMANALRLVSIDRGRDPRSFAMFAYGGMLPLFAAQICGRLGIDRVVIPANSSVFCAFGVLVADFVRRHSRSVGLVPVDGAPVPELNGIRDDLEALARQELTSEGFAAAETTLVWGADLRFLGQAFEVWVPLPARPLAPADLAELSSSFPKAYEQTYGAGTAWEGAPVVIVNLTVTASATRAKPALAAAQFTGAIADVSLRERRRVLVMDQRRYVDVPVYEGARFTAGTAVQGPAVIDEHDTTLYLPPGWRCRRDELANYVLEAEK
jgi:N-methylhydantoinase A